ncbi:DUF4179 domain-containing protein [Cytobacillus solani]|uniref:DUF4179 domain-containing protein n=1 Tax=Cytobacillus solani TaxID=1637975 RepID=A0A0Q3VG10_9BACI|nr:DUF4179 domain-containing protein [Cytobacillus solani]KOP81292.1 hypothetical protein AMS60_01525 [Bacillus sp. FJAT-21945]KQL18306.1 hypothetical protein AN957_06715 [Cytobacillus solani]USK56153.1 DUF4179 domain-containing protein [Cytobacillus solani]
MEKNSFQEVYEKIEVPQEDVLKAIQNGMNRASFDVPKTKRNTKIVVWSTVAAAAILVSSSFISPSMSHVMANVPLLGKIYETFNDAIGRSLQSQELITELNKTASSKGIDVTITNAYYDGAVVGVTFNVKGNLNTEESGKVVGFYEIFDGDEGISDSKELVHMEPTDDGYIGHIQLSYPESELPQEATFPLEFKTIGGKEGSWRFDVPINQLPYETVTIDKESSEEFSGVKVHFDSILFGQASTAINYTATFPIQGKHDQVRLEVYDDKGDEINISMDGIDLKTIEENDHIIVKGRSIIPQSVKGETKYLEVHPKVAINEQDQFVSLNASTPVEIKADRQNLAVTIEKITVNDHSLGVDFQVNYGDEMGRSFGFFKDFARNDVLFVKETEKDIYMEPMQHAVKTIHKDELRFRSTFDIRKLDGFNLNNYVIRVNLGSLRANIPVELDKVKMDVN